VVQRKAKALASLQMEGSMMGDGATTSNMGKGQWSGLTAVSTKVSGQVGG
jgi:hypothetical protein